MNLIATLERAVVALDEVETVELVPWAIDDR